MYSLACMCTGFIASFSVLSINIYLNIICRVITSEVSWISFHLFIIFKSSQQPWEINLITILLETEETDIQKT